MIGKQLIPTKQLYIFFTLSSVLECHCENTRNSDSEVFFQSAFLESRQILEKNLRRGPCFSKTASWKSRTFLILKSYIDILPRIFLKFWRVFIGANFFRNIPGWLLLKPVDTKYSNRDSQNYKWLTLILSNLLFLFVLIKTYYNKYQILNGKHGVHCITILCVLW